MQVTCVFQFQYGFASSNVQLSAAIHREKCIEGQKPPRQKSEATTRAFTDHRSTIFSLFDDFAFRVDALP